MKLLRIVFAHPVFINKQQVNNKAIQNATSDPLHSITTSTATLQKAGLALHEVPKVMNAEIYFRPKGHEEFVHQCRLGWDLPQCLPSAPLH